MTSLIAKIRLGLEDKDLWRKQIREAGYTSPLKVEVLGDKYMFIIGCLNNCSHIFGSGTSYIFSYVFVYI